MKYLVPIALVVFAVWFFGSRAMSSAKEKVATSSDSISNAGELLDRAASGKPLDGRPAPDARWVQRMTTACAERERLLASVPRVATPNGIADRGSRILAIHHAFSTRVASLRPPAAWRPEAREIRRFNAHQTRILQRVAAAARSGDLGRAAQEAVALRDLAGRANAVFLRLGLDRCAFGASGIPI